MEALFNRVLSKKASFFFFFFSDLLLFLILCGLLKFPNQGSSLLCPALKAWSLNHWTTREIPRRPHSAPYLGSTCALRESHSWKCSPLPRNYPPTHQIPQPPPLQGSPNSSPKAYFPWFEGEKGSFPFLVRCGLGDRQSECPDISLKRVFCRVLGGYSLFERQVTEDMALSPAASPPPEF